MVLLVCSLTIQRKMIISQLYKKDEHKKPMEFIKLYLYSEGDEWEEVNSWWWKIVALSIDCDLTKREAPRKCMNFRCQGRIRTSPVDVPSLRHRGYHRLRHRRRSGTTTHSAKAAAGIAHAESATAESLSWIWVVTREAEHVAWDRAASIANAPDNHPVS